METVTGYYLEFDSIPEQTGVPKPPPFGGFERQLIDDEKQGCYQAGFFLFR